MGNQDSLNDLDRTKEKIQYHLLNQMHDLIVNKRHSRRSAHLNINQKENQKKMRIFPPSLYPKLLIYTQTYLPMFTKLN